MQTESIASKGCVLSIYILITNVNIQLYLIRLDRIYRFD